MGNQNATAMHEEDEAAKQSNMNPSNNESSVVEESKDDQLIPPTAKTHELSAASASELPDPDPRKGARYHHADDQALDTKEQDGYDEAQGTENEATDTKDDPKDQEIKDTTLSSTEEAVHEPDAPLDSDARVDDLALEKLNQDPSLHVRRGSELSSFNIDEVSIKSADGEIEGHVAENILGAQDQLKEVIDTVDISPEQECKNHPETGFIEEVNKESSSPKASHNEDLLHTEALSDALEQHHDTNEEAERIKAMSYIDEKADSDQVQVLKPVMDTDLKVNASSDNMLSCEEAVEGSDGDQAEIFCKVAEESEAEKGPELADFKDLEIVDAKADISCNLAYEKTDQIHPQEAGSEDVVGAQQNTQSPMEKSPSFNFGLVSWDKNEELDQTPLLYHKKLTTMRSLSMPGNARLFIPPDRPAEEKTITIVQEKRREYNEGSRSPLQSFLNEKEETHMLKPQENHQQAENDQNLDAQKESQKGHGMEIVPSLAEGKEKRNKVKISGSYFFSICICCTGVAQLNADP